MPTAASSRHLFGVPCVTGVTIARKTFGLASFRRRGRAGLAFATLGGAGLTTIMALRETSVTYLAFIFATAPLCASARIGAGDKPDTAPYTRAQDPFPQAYQ